MSAIRERAPHDAPVSLQHRALDNIRYIRDTMASARRLTAVPGWGVVAVGVTALVAAAVAELATQTVEAWLAVWLGEAVLAATVVMIALAGKTRAVGSTLLEGTLQRFVYGMIPPLVAGAALTIVLYRAGAVDALPGTWMLLYGAALVGGGAGSVRAIPLTGLCFMLAGIGALVAPAAWDDALLALGFGVFHVVFGLMVARRHGG